LHMVHRMAFLQRCYVLCGTLCGGRFWVLATIAPTRMVDFFRLITVSIPITLHPFWPELGALRALALILVNVSRCYSYPISRRVDAIFAWPCTGCFRRHACACRSKRSSWNVISLCWRDFRICLFHTTFSLLLKAMFKPWKLKVAAESQWREWLGCEAFLNQAFGTVLA